MTATVAQPRLDVLIRNGWVADGTGNPVYPADIAIRGDRIIEVGHVPQHATAARVIDATGKIVCPGFVDAHSHSDRSIHANPTAQSTIRHEHLAEVISHPLFSLAVDGWTSQIDGPLSERSRHPLYFSGMVHYLTHHVRECHTLRLEEAIRKMTNLPATRFELRDRGLLRAGCFADVVVFDYAALDDGSTIEQPLAYCRGVEHVLVNGTAVVSEGEHTGPHPGRTLRRR